MKCIKCNIEKSETEFYYRKDNNKYRLDCKSCFKNNVSNYRKNNCDKIVESKKKYYYNNQQERCEKSRNWYNDNKELKNKNHTIYMRLRRQNDIEFKIYSNIQSRIYSALKNNIKEETTNDIIGCTIKYYRKWLEYQFNENMNWDNHGTYWHIDHVKPCASYDFHLTNHIKDCFNWKNVRPIEKYINLSKNDKIDEHLIHKHSELVNKFLLLKQNNFVGSEKTEV